MNHPARLGAALAVAAVTFVGVGAVPRASAELDLNLVWSASATADAMAIEYLNTAAPIFAAEPIIYGTPATARSLVDSNNQSNAMAAAPYPGDVMVGMPDNGNGALAVAGLPGVFPTYAFIAQSDHAGNPHEVKDQSGNRLEANSSPYASSSSARSGVITGDFLASMQAQASSAASVDSTTGELIAVADSRLDAFKFTDALQIGRSTAHAKVQRAPGAEVVRESSFTLGSIIVNGTEMSYGDGGFKYGDQTAPPPGDPKALFDALKPAGITVEILPAKTTETSVQSEGMKITQVQDYGSYQQRISFILGAVTARVEGEAKPATTDPLFGGFDPVGQSPSEPAPGTAPAAAPPALESSYSVQPRTAFDTFTPVTSSLTLTLPSYDAPDLSLPPPVSGAPVTPEIVEAITPDTEQVASPPQGEVRLATPASVGRALRDDDYGGAYLGFGLIAALVALGAFIPALVKNRRPAGASVLKL